LDEAFEDVRTDLGFMPWELSFLSQMTSGCWIVAVFTCKDLVSQCRRPSVCRGLVCKVHLEWVRLGEEDEGMCSSREHPTTQLTVKQRSQTALADAV
jgi:hypothetical protein